MFINRMMQQYNQRNTWLCIAEYSAAAEARLPWNADAGRRNNTVLGESILYSASPARLTWAACSMKMTGSVTAF
jgi:hypothetical protein